MLKKNKTLIKIIKQDMIPAEKDLLSKIIHSHS